jgi:D-3-phosphoglycerate dehydrogenase
MRILTRTFSDVGRETLRGYGHEVIFDPGLSAGTLPESLAKLHPEVLVVRSTEVTDKALAASSELSLVIRAGAGVNTIDLESASRRGIFVTNCPGQNSIAVAELVFG